LKIPGKKVQIRRKRRMKMAKTGRYEKYIVRKPGIRGKNGAMEFPDNVVAKSAQDTGPLIFLPAGLKDLTNSGAEYGIISGELSVGTGLPGSFKPHKHDFGELFLFLGTDAKNLNDLGAVAEFWLGEDDELEKVVLDTPASVYVPGGLAHFPLTWKNVRRPCVFVVIASISHTKMTSMPQATTASMKGRPGAV
jgi:hypothetical protein